VGKSKSRIIVEESVDFAYIRLNDDEYLEDLQIRGLQEELLTLVDEVKERRFVIDFEKVTHMSSAFLGLLIRVLKRVKEQKSELELVNIRPEILKVFKITRLDKIFEIGKTK
jgi:anti-sigma B factor antagonist